MVDTFWVGRLSAHSDGHAGFLQALRAAPCYGQDNDYVYGELLKLSAEERAALEREKII